MTGMLLEPLRSLYHWIQAQTRKWKKTCMYGDALRLCSDTDANKELGYLVCKDPRFRSSLPLLRLNQ